jgi:spermidine synthase
MAHANEVKPSWPFVVAVGWGAFLLFQLQPVLAKPLLPTLGGVPMVWMGCMLAFQALLLLGYSYAFWLSARSARLQWALHLALWLVVVLSLLFPLPPIFAFDPATQPLGWLLEELLRRIGVPFIALAATTPLVQRWALQERPEIGANAYRLYVASNLGSFIGLLSYPFIIEPWLTLGQQWTWLTVGFVVQACLLTWAVLRCRHAARKTSIASSAVDTPVAPRPPLRSYAAWVGLAALGCSLMLGTTHYLSLDIASIPLLWVLPLALYLLSFTIAFGRWAFLITSNTRVVMLVVATLLLLSSGMAGMGMLLAQVAVWLLGMFVLCCVVHYWLAKAQPAPEHAAGYYLAISFGGVLAGVFNGLLAPILFIAVVEHLLVLGAVAVVAVWRANPRPWEQGDSRQWKLLPFITIFPVLVMAALFQGLLDKQEIIRAIVVFAAALLGFIYIRQPQWRWAQLMPVLALLFVPFGLHYGSGADRLLQARSWFGVTQVKVKDNGAYHQLVHGNTVHGIQLRAPGKEREILSYYAPLKHVWPAFPPVVTSEPLAVVGLGAGTLACLRSEGQEADLYEIDPLMVDVAKDSRYFSYLEHCAPNEAIYVGDGRLMMARQPDQRYGLIVLDAFSSDAVPVHLLTKEALVLYLQKLQPEGVLAFNISNRYLDMLPVLKALATDAGLHSYFMQYAPKNDTRRTLLFPAQWVLMSRQPIALEQLQADAITTVELHDADLSYLWRDDYSALWRVVK